ncbi:MAG: hypothetical protein KA314_21165 [Chloroflexi bacterium]|nr:hypothetical protein [Chloroflexota bacterium]MBP8058351.1 hypothetical protein [Chloroflexota bacterium]
MKRQQHVTKTQQILTGLFLWLLVACATPEPETIPSIAPSHLSPAAATIQPSSAAATPSLLPAQTVESGASNPATPITTRLWLPYLPRLNEPVEMVLTFDSILDAPGTTATIILPQGTTLTAGSLEWQGDLAANVSQILTATIVFTTIGDKVLEGKALRPLENGDVWGDAAYIYLHVNETFSQLGFGSSSTPLTNDADPSPPPVNPSP